MRSAGWGRAGAVVLALLCACQSEPTGGPPDSATDVSLDRPRIPDHPGAEGATPDLQPPDLGPDAGQAGEIRALTYNVAGLPFGLSKSDPDANTPLISPLLNPFDLALIQEDFSYTTQLSSAATHPFKSSPGPPSGAILNDGLTLFSRLPFKNLARHKWTQCYGMLDHGSDCLAAKGFSVADLELAPGLVVHVYNLHMDAGQDPLDHSARAAQVDQLLAEIATRSSGAAVIVGGDTNLKLSAAVDNQGLLDKLLTQGGLTDACQALGCGDPRIDRIFYRSSATIELQALSWTVDPGFVDSQGQPLSDHEAVAVRIRWAVRGPAADGGLADALTGE